MRRESSSDAAYLFGLTRLLRLPLQIALGVRAAFPSWMALIDAGPQGSAAGTHSRSLGSALARAARDGSLWQSARDVIERHRDAGISAVAITDDDYPPLLRGLLNPPAVLFVKGDIEAVRGPGAVAVVGTRRSTPSGDRRARSISLQLVRAGFTVVAGLARGIDTAAHAAAVAAGGRTVAVCATPLDRVYPAENRRLAEAIQARGGALVSEYPLGDRTYPSCFKHRDRIQAGMSITVLPIQTPGDDGTMHTVRYAEMAGRLIFCPTPPRGEARRRAWAGVRALLSDGRATALGRISEFVRLLRRHRDRLLESIASTAMPLNR